MPPLESLGAMPYSEGMRHTLSSSFHMQSYEYFLYLGCLCIRDNSPKPSGESNVPNGRIAQYAAVSRIMKKALRETIDFAARLALPE